MNNSQYSEIESVLRDNGFSVWTVKPFGNSKKIDRLGIFVTGILLEKTASNIRSILSDFDVVVDVMKNAEEIWITLK